MIFYKNSVNQAFFPFIFFCFFFKTEMAVGKVFDRVVAKVNSEIITLSSIETKVVSLKQQYRSQSIKIEEKNCVSIADIAKVTHKSN